MSAHFNRLSPATAEMLALIAEEAGEIVQAVAKALRHGLDSVHPETDLDNTTALENEIGDLLAAVQIATSANVLTVHQIELAKRRKLERVGRYLHHAKVPKATP